MTLGEAIDYIYHRITRTKHKDWITRWAEAWVRRNKAILDRFD